MELSITHAKGTYSVTINSKNIFSHQLNRKKTKPEVCIIIDINVYNLYWKKINPWIRKQYQIKGIYKFSSSENNKSLHEIEKILWFLNTNNCTKKTKLISIGGGITGDISAFAASIFMRGVSYINIPTTLLSMVDSSIGGKTGINFNRIKNLVGTFHQPEAVYIFTDFLKTLPEEEFESGLGELIKYSFISGKNGIDLRNCSTINNQLIADCIKVKAAIVQKDEYEISGLRKLLNYGHTFAHGIESSSNFRIKHGKAVLLGIIVSLFYSYRVKLISADFLYRSLSSISSISKFTSQSLKLIYPDKVIESMKQDKKASAGKVKLVLITQSHDFVLDFPARKNLIISSIDDMKVWVKESFKKETVEK